ncbi:hypothetical protein EG327_005025 [Venturia inaequalis]|uniref:Uncharacterized protein n=1 Tax=Venturia inaequalis TaxID=5025 RepID=A0A8H3VC87_VENIN|nr:hypothetical protein EG327_005025 [Venturia inaequalis]
MISQPGPKFERKILLMQMGGLLPATVEGDQEFRQGKYALLGTSSVELQTGISPSKITFPLVDDDGECAFSDRLYSSRDFLTTMYVLADISGFYHGVSSVGSIPTSAARTQTKNLKKSKAAGSEWYTESHAHTRLRNTEAQQAVLERDETMNVLNMRRSQMTTKVASLAQSYIAMDFGHLFDKLQSQHFKPRFK